MPDGRVAFELAGCGPIPDARLEANESYHVGARERARCRARAELIVNAGNSVGSGHIA
jgi:hypothetical protein